MTALSPTEQRHHFGPLLQRLRTEKRVTLSRLARHLGVSVVYLSDVEHSRKAPLRDGLIRRAAEGLEIPPDCLFEAAILDRGEVRFDEEGNPWRAQAAARLCAAWPRLTEEQMERILGVIGEEAP